MNLKHPSLSKSCTFMTNWKFTRILDGRVLCARGKGFTRWGLPCGHPVWKLDMNICLEGVWYGRSSKNDFRELKFNAGVGQRRKLMPTHLRLLIFVFRWMMNRTMNGKPDSPTLIFLLMVKVA